MGEPHRASRLKGKRVGHELGAARVNGKSMRASALRWLAPLLWMVLIFWVSSRVDPYRELAQFLGLASAALPEGQFRLLPMLSNDALGQAAHAAEFFILGLLLGWAGRPVNARGWWALLAFGAAFALTDEVHQSFVPERAFQWGDLGIDCVSVAVGLLAARAASAPGGRRGRRTAAAPT